MQGCACRASRPFSTRSPTSDAVRLPTPFASRAGAGRARPICRASRVGAYLVDHPAFYDRAGGPYGGPDGRDWPDNYRRFGLLSWVAAALGQGADPNWRPDIVHAHDWHAGLAPAYLKAQAEPVAERDDRA